MGDWKAGHHYDPPFRIADAAAASAAVPYAIGALRLPLPEEGWYEIDPSNEKPRARKTRSFETVALWDGGAYENLGLEPLYKIDRGMIDCDYVIVSDASGPLPVGRRPLLSSLLHGNLAGPRLFDITSDQIRSLRSRMFVNALNNNKAAGAVIRMGNSVRDIDIGVRRDRQPSDYARFQADREASLALKHPTNLSSLPADIFLRIARHGFEVADATLTAYCPAVVPQSMLWSDFTRAS
jgi:NTE family protein